MFELFFFLCTRYGKFSRNFLDYFRHRALARFVRSPFRLLLSKFVKLSSLLHNGLDVDLDISVEPCRYFELVFL